MKITEVSTRVLDMKIMLYSSISLQRKMSVIIRIKIYCTRIPLELKKKEFTVFVCLFHEVVHLCLGGVLPQGSQYRPQLLHRDRPIPVPIEHLKAFDKFYVERNKQKYKIELLNGFLWWHTFAIYMQDKLKVIIQHGILTWDLFMSTCNMIIVAC